jgi:polar amino acid transport system substrate-binding protein
VAGLSSFTDRAIKELAPTGKLRVGIAVGPAASALWCVRDLGTGKARGVPVELGTALAQWLKVPVELVEYDSSGKIIAATNANAWDVTFVPVDDDRQKAVDFGAPYHLLQSTYLVAPGSVIKTVDEVQPRGRADRGRQGTRHFAPRSAPRRTRRQSTSRGPTRP